MYLMTYLHFYYYFILAQPCSLSVSNLPAGYTIVGDPPTEIGNVPFITKYLTKMNQLW